MKCKIDGNCTIPHYYCHRRDGAARAMLRVVQVAHYIIGRGAHPNLSQEIDVDQVFDELIRFGIDVHMGQHDARVVHHYVHGAQFVHDRRMHVPNLLPVGDVDFVTFGHPATSIDRLCRLGAPFAVDVNASDFGAQRVEPQAKLAAQTSSCPGNLYKLIIIFCISQ